MLVVAPATGYDSFVSVADADAYHGRMGNELWLGTEPQKETWLRRATQYVLIHYSLNASAYDPVHPNVVAAVSELALRAREGPFYEETQAQSAVVQETVGPITMRYANPSVPNRFALIDDLLRGLTYGLSGQVPIYRA